eukprot:gene13824-16296_t
MKKRNQYLLHRFVEVWCKLEMRNGRGKPITGAEEYLLKKLKHLNDTIGQSNSIKAKVEELSNQVVLSTMEQERIRFELTPASLASLHALFKTMTQSIDSMTSELEYAMQDATILHEELSKLQRLL